MPGQLSAWTRDIVDVLQQSPGPQQLTSMAEWLQRLSGVDHFVLFVYEDADRPQPLFDTFSGGLRQLFVDEYQIGPYLQDPFYLASRQSQTGAMSSMRQLAPDRFYVSEYFRTYYHHLGLCEEVGFFVNMGAQVKAVLSLMRRRSSGAYHSDDIQLMSEAIPVVDAVVRAAWSAHLHAVRRNDEIRAEFENFGQGVLTARECEIARLLLQGYSNISLSEQLGISPGTVKVHRKHIYDKLGIGSQSELLALFIRERHPSKDA
ncbi:helix-turn-helix transcriptional regulator [Pseudomonas chlororaphis]|uniref:helix-turn-helix transcriptional regulator n=1 Tax=Pseudomonas chlororaphis TaxID=587753 RepID=UPI000F57893E|nr:LuxR C-terminal-related transcriptional regulator [Pseudomonas chlororaphis]